MVTFWNLSCWIELDLGSKSFYSFRNWKVIVDKTIYYINVCAHVAHQNGFDKDSSVCSSSLDDRPDTRENLGSLSKRVVNPIADAAGFSLEYTGGECNGHSSGPKTWKTTIFMKCGKFLVS